jgi:hypothetical protein
MPRGSKGEKLTTDVIGNAVRRLNRKDVYVGMRSLGVRGERLPMIYSRFRALAQADKNTKPSLWLIDVRGQVCVAKIGNS